MSVSIRTDKDFNSGEATLQVAMTSSPLWLSCRTSSKPIPLLAPVIKYVDKIVVTLLLE